ncbi:TRAP transporter large permease [Natribacillus halophilus]|uniref:C4-dicarboxylate transporter, DctM subunit n=1 Tax=Natribacillus halophilus TaxID=549003 RepID=A0A1G8JXN1_9BACI|nr:TRAP transporter large permease subunit [Natribacillus halophilus]SDI35915.1 C4-dicarboxylate transporter, DctM subunit [Natribacillus halophilus]
MFILTILLIFLLVLLFLGAPIFVSLSLSTFLVAIFMTDTNVMVLVQSLFGGIDQFALMALPFFILAANFMDVGGLSKRIMDLARTLVGHLTGGLAMTTQVSSMMFGALSGSGPATVVAIGKVMYPEMTNRNYPAPFAAGLLASAGAVALIIPPSITLIVYGAVTGVSVGNLFMAGITAGIIIGLSSMVYIYIYAKRQGIPRDPKSTWPQLGKALKNASWAILVPVIILGGIYSGIFTPTEAAGISAVYALLIGMFVYREINITKLISICRESAITSAQILIMVASAQLLGWFLTRLQVPQMMTEIFLDNITTAFFFLLMLNIILLVMGMFMEGMAAIVILAPLILPASQVLGIDPVHLGIVMVSNLAIGMFTPPFGLNIFVSSSVTEVGMVKMLPTVLKFFLFNLVALLIITYVPQIVLFLPSL